MHVTRACHCNFKVFCGLPKSLINYIIILCFSIRHSLILLDKISEVAHHVCIFFGAHEKFEPCFFRTQCTVKSFVKWGTSCEPCKLAEAVTFANFTRKVPDFNRGHNTIISSGNTQIFQTNVEIILKIMQSDS
jgi:hypothetical protein